MPVEAIRPANNKLSAGDTSSRWTAAVWRNIHIQGIRNGLVDGLFWEWDFGSIKPSSNINAAEAYWDQGLMAFGDNGASLVFFPGTGLDTGMTVASDGDNEGASLRHQNAPFSIARGQKSFAMEVCLETSTITDTKHGFFVGLIENVAGSATVPIAADGTLADKNLVGFHRLEGDGDKLDLVYKADGVTQVSQMLDAITLVAATEVRLGMTFNPQADPFNGLSYCLRWWCNGKPIEDTGTTAGSLGYKQIPSAAGTDFPNDIGLGFIFALLNATATTPGSTTIKRARIAQEL